MENLGEFIVNHWILVTAFVVLLFLVFSDFILGKASGVEKLEANQAVRLVNKAKGKFIDVREVDEFENSHIADSINVPVAKLDEKIKGVKNQSQALVIVCANGQKSVTAAKKLKDQGYEEVYVLSGGLGAWKEAKLPLFS